MKSGDSQLFDGEGLARFRRPGRVAAVLGRRLVLLVLDDAWDKSHVEMFDCVDAASNSCVLVTSRVSGIVVGAPEVQLGRNSDH